MYMIHINSLPCVLTLTYLWLILTDGNIDDLILYVDIEVVCSIIAYHID